LSRALSAAVFVTAALTLASCRSTTAVNTTPASTSAAGAPDATSAKSKPAATPTAPAKKAGVGSAIDLKGTGGGALQVTLVKIVDPAAPDNEFLTPSAGTHFVAVQLRIVNKGTAAYSDDPQMETKVKDAEGESFAINFGGTTAGTAMDPGLNLAPGDTALGFLTFQVPDGKKITQVQYSVSLFGGNVAQWTIG
jgi:hypothetical protein